MVVKEADPCEGTGEDAERYWPCDECWAREGERCEFGDV